MSTLEQAAKLTLSIQLAMLFSIFCLSLLWYEKEIVTAAVFGGLISFISTAYFAARLIYSSKKSEDAVLLRGLGTTQISKYFLVFALLYLGLKVLNLNALPLLLALAVTQVAYWLVLVRL